MEWRRARLLTVLVSVLITCGVLAGFAPIQALAQERSNGDKRVSCKFDAAPLSEVLEWLSKHGQSYVADETLIGAKRKLTINIVDQPMKDVVDAIAEAMGCTWVKKGDVYVLRQGRIGQWLLEDTFRQSDKSPVIERPFNRMQVLPRVEWQPIEPPPILDSKSLKELDDPNWLLREVERALKEVERAMTEAEKGGKRVLKSPAERERLRKEIARAREEIAKSLKDTDKPRLTPKVREFSSSEEKDALRMSLGTQDLGALRKSLTDAQKQKAKKQGYLKLEDLTPDQKKLLGDVAAGASWSITFVQDGESITIKSK